MRSRGLQLLIVENWLSPEDIDLIGTYVHSLMGSWYDGSFERWDIAGRSRSLGTFPWRLFLALGPVLFFSAF